MTPSTRSLPTTNLILVALGALALCAIQYGLPLHLRQAATLSTTTPTFTTLITSSYVHLSSSHFLDNLLAYLACGTLTCLLCHTLGRPTWYHRTFLALVTLGPLLSSILTLQLLRFVFPTLPIVTYGFSGVVAGFAGFLFVILFVLLRDTYDKWIASYSIILVVAGAVSMLLVRYVSPLPSTELGVIAVSACISLAGIGNQVRRIDFTTQSTPSLQAIILGVLILLLAVLCLVFVAALFPAIPASGGATTNVYAHASGVLVGAVLAVGCEKW